MPEATVQVRGSRGSCAAVAMAMALLVLSTTSGTRAQPRGGDDASPQGVVDRTDPCLDHVPPGEANGREHHCPPVGSSAGIARGDFDCDGIADLAVGVPDDSVPSNGTLVPGAGSVEIVYAAHDGTGLPGTANPTNATPNQWWFQGNFNGAGANMQLFGPPGAGAEFGAALAAGDFNHDGCTDLAIGIPNYSIPSGPSHIGAVIVMYGTPLGLDVGPEVVPL